MAGTGRADSRAMGTVATAVGASTTPSPVARLAAGWAWSVDLMGGASASSYSVAPVLGEGAALGMFFGSSPREAWSLELLETGNLVLDATTPQFGLVGLGARHLAKPDDPLFGPPGKTIDFQRLAAGVALAYDGRQLSTGLGAEATVAYLIRGPHGVAVHLGAYLFDSSRISHDTLVMLSVGYVLSPVKNRPYVRPAPPVPGRDETRVCRDLSAYRYALAEARGQAIGACKDEPSPACEQIRARIRVLAEGFNSCQLGKDVGPPAQPDAP